MFLQNVIKYESSFINDYRTIQIIEFISDEISCLRGFCKGIEIRASEMLGMK